MSMIKDISNEKYNNKTTLNDLKETIASISSTPDGELKYGKKSPSLNLPQKITQRLPSQSF